MPKASRGSPLSAPRFWYQSRNLPHFDATTFIQAITYRLSDSLPQQITQRLADELTPDAESRCRRRIEQYLDVGHGSCCLINPAIAQDIVDTWHRISGERYHLHAWCIMPNHVHVMIEQLPGHSLGSIVQSWKSWTGKRIKALTVTVTWQRDYWDRYIRDESHYRQAIAYIQHNPVKAGLSASPAAWPWSSATTPGTLGEYLKMSLCEQSPRERRALARLRVNSTKGEQGLASPGRCCS